MIKSALRKSDENGEKIVANFLDEKFYEKHTTNFERVNRKEEQVKGIDTIFKYNGETFLCDEKAAIQYRNRDLQTFSLELSFLNRRNDINNGWLLDSNKINDSFLFCWLNKTKEPFNSKEDIEELEIALVSRNRILDYLEELGWTISNLKIKDSKIRNNEKEYLGNIKKDGIKFSKSFQLVEKPINILIPKDILIKISKIHLKLK